MKTLLNAIELKDFVVKTGGWVRINVEGTFIDPDTGEFMKIVPENEKVGPPIITLFRKKN